MSLQVELLYEQRGYLLLADRIQMFIVGIVHGLLCAPRAAWIQDWIMRTLDQAVKCSRRRIKKDTQGDAWLPGL